MAAARAKKDKPPPGPDDLVRGSAGMYRTGDGRFEVQKSDQGWFLIDSQQANEFGQQLIHGPLPTLDALRAALPGAREIKPLLRVRPAVPSKTASSKTTGGGTNTRAEATKREPPPPPKTWLDKLPEAEARQARKLIQALERQGVHEAEDLVRHHRDEPAALAARIIEQRLRALVNEQPETERERAHDLVRRATDVLAAQGCTMARPSPRWALVEVRDDDEPPRRINPRP